jgi:hypothetical protein
MPIERFKGFAEAREALWLRPGDPRIAEKMRKLWAFSSQLAPWPHPRGLWKFRSQEEANEHREAWIDERVRLVREGRAQQS